MGKSARKESWGGAVLELWSLGPSGSVDSLGMTVLGSGTAVIGPGGNVLSELAETVEGGVKEEQDQKTDSAKTPGKTRG